MLTKIESNSWMLLLVAGLIAVAGCTDPEPTDDTTPGTNEQVTEDEELPPLSSLESVIGDHPEENGETLERFDQKFDLNLPQSFDLLDTQSPVQNQGRRGVCSIFSTVGLMEHLYIKAGEPMPDFSEQYLQWSTKFEVGAFPNTSGSSGRVNLDAITRFGIPEEDAWPYESSAWGASDDAECSKEIEEDERPKRCFTNGEPPEEALAAKKFFLPRREFVSSFPNSIKTYMFKNKRAVVSGMTFFYQSWNHGGTKLAVNQDNKRAGAVVFPSQGDQDDSLERRAGHSILLVGWDDNKTFPRLDEEGNPLLDENGEPVVDKGFFLFKNSWGTGGSWGSENEFGKGYGWISYRYVQRWGRSVSAVEPELEQPMVEICGDGIDNDRNGSSDCDDAVCAEEAICVPQNTTEIFSSAPDVEIPDNDIDGVNDSINVELDGVIKSLVVTVKIEHSWRGDLDVVLSGPNGDVAILVEKNDDAGKNIEQTFVVEDFNGISPSGEWTLNVSDSAKIDTGVLKEWSLEITN